MYQNLDSQPQDDPQPHQQQVMYDGSVEEQKRVKYKNILYNLGMAEIILGGISCILGLATLIGVLVRRTYFWDEFTFVSQGVWCGGFIIASGILGLRAKSNPSRCIFNANMGVSITASVFMGVLIFMSANAAIFSNLFVMICHILLAIVGLTGMIIAIVHAAYCCAGVCCFSIHYRGAVRYSQQQISMQPMMQVQLANGQYMMVPYQPVLQPTVQQGQTPAPTDQMPTTSMAAVSNSVPPTASETYAKPTDNTTYPHQQI